ncbi:MAG: esterase/lipase family protein [Cyanobium sp.]
MAIPAQPILILGGFLISPHTYTPMAARLQQLSGQPVVVVPVSRAEWLLTVFAFAWARILDRVQTNASDLARRSASGRITLIGHSSGGIMLRQQVAQRLPGCPFADRVHYLSLAGDLDLESATPLAQRLAPTAYRNSTGNADDRGDGLVPVASALLAGSTPLVLPGVAHGGAFGSRWYGSPEVVEQWWTALQSQP